MPRHSFTRTGKLTFRVRSVRSSGQSRHSRQQSRRYQEVLRRNAEELALIQDLFRRNNQYIREHEMDADFGRVNLLSAPEFVETLLAHTDSRHSRRPAPKEEDRQESNEAGESNTEKTEKTDNADGSSAKQAKNPGAKPDSFGDAQEPSEYLRIELAGFGRRW